MSHSPSPDTRRGVLILDDDPKVLHLLTSYLLHPEVELVACQEIEAAECLLDRRPFHVFISDLKLSQLGGMDGMHLVRHVATNFPAIRTVVFSGHVTPQVQQLAETLGVRDVMEKPGDLPRLREIVFAGLTEREAFTGTPNPGRVSVVELLETALTSDNMRANFQPIMSLQKGGPPFMAYGVESLTRGPAGSILENPEILFGYAAHKEKFFEADMLALDLAFAGAKSLPKGGILFVNVQPRSMSHPQFTDNLHRIIEEHDSDPGSVVLEITEQRTIVNPEAFAATTAKLRDHGFRVALDDYGEGFANLQLVHDLQPDFLKISGYFCGDIQQEPRKQAMVASAVHLANELGISTVMEHVETADELEAVRELGVQFGQGYFFSRPLPADEVAHQIEFQDPADEGHQARPERGR